MYNNAQYIFSPETTHINTIRVDINGVTSFVPLDLANTDYLNIMKLVEEGELVIQPAEETE